MNRALILSVKPQHAYNILNGDKTLELRKSVPKGYKGWVYVYVTKGKPYLYNFANLDFGLSNEKIKQKYHTLLNGTIPFRFWFDEYERIRPSYYPSMKPIYEITFDTLNLLKLNKSQINDYGNGKDLYAWHIKNLEIFDKPMQLSEFYKTDSKYIQDYERLVLTYDNKIIKSESKLKKLPITKAPQSYMYAWVKEEGK